MQKIEKSLNQTINQLLLMFCSFNTERETSIYFKTQFKTFKPCNPLNDHKS